MAPTTFSKLPNEILITLLSTLPTRDLLPITLVSRRIHVLILRILEARLLSAASLLHHKLILEVFHPSTKYTTPYNMCDYLGVGTHDKILDVVDGKVAKNEVGGEMSLGKLKGLYSHFRPLQPVDERRPRRNHPAGGPFPGSTPAAPSASASTENITEGQDEKEKEETYPTQTLHLEDHELFSQLCILTNLVKVGPKRGLFLSCVNVGDGIIRVWREWLGSQSKRFVGSESGEDEKWEETEVGVKDKAEVQEASGLLWSDTEQHIGLKMRVREFTDLNPPVLEGEREGSVSYELAYEELVIRSTKLLLMVEQSWDQEVGGNGKAVVIGSWDE